MFSFLKKLFQKIVTIFSSLLSKVMFFKKIIKFSRKNTFCAKLLKILQYSTIKNPWHQIWIYVASIFNLLAMSNYTYHSNQCGLNTLNIYAWGLVGQIYL
jgi:hypothetical protein